MDLSSFHVLLDSFLPLIRKKGMQCLCVTAFLLRKTIALPTQIASKQLLGMDRLLVKLFYRVYPKAQLISQEQTLYNRLRIGRTYLTHSYLLKDEDPPICIPCNSLLTVEHILISCNDFDIIRQNFYTASNLKDLFHNIHPTRIISFVHAIGLNNKL